MNTHSESFSTLTTLRVGGGINHVERPESKDDCVAHVRSLDEKKEELLILGGGSNVLARDDFFTGTVLIPSFNNIVFESVGDTVRVIADAGVVWDTLVEKTVERDLWGFENLSSIPGNVGAAPMQNIGAYGSDISETLEYAEVYDRLEKKIRILSHKELAFGYRTSVLKKERGRFVVLSVSFLLSSKSKRKLSYKDLQERFGDSEPRLGEIRDAVIDIRKNKFPDLSLFGTAGSFFLNPILSGREASALIAQYPNIPHFPDGEQTKISLAWLLDNVVHAKGMRVGDAFVWDKQPLVIATEKSATGSDVRALMNVIQEKIFEVTKIKIVPEVFVM